VHQDGFYPIMIHADAFVQPQENEWNDQSARNRQGEPAQRLQFSSENKWEQQDQQVGFCQDHDSQQDAALKIFPGKKMPDRKATQQQQNNIDVTKIQFAGKMNQDAGKCD